MKLSSKSNCLLGAIAIKYRLGGKIEWRSGWRKDWAWPKRCRGLLGNPWGHFRVRLGNYYLSYSTKKKDLSAWNQLWFDGYIKRKIVSFEDIK